MKKAISLVFMLLCPSKLESLNYATQGDISWATRGLVLDFIKGVYTKKQ